MKSQSSTEFMIFIGIGIIILMIYFGIANTYLNLSYRQKDIISGQDLAKQIKNEINLAARVEDNYERTFQVPSIAGGKQFSVHIESREITVKINDLDYTELLEIDVNGIDISPEDIIMISKASNQVTLLKV